MQVKINVSGKDHSLLFGYTCYKLFMTRCFKYRDTYLNGDGEITMLGLANLFHSAYLNGCYDKQVDVVLTYDALAEWLDERYGSEEGRLEVSNILEIWAASKEIKKLTEDAEKKNQEMNLASQISTS